MCLANSEIKAKAKETGVCLWEVAEKFGVTDKTFSVWLRKEFSPKKKAQALAFIDEIAAGRQSDDE